LHKFENHQNYNCKITLESGEEYLIYANWLHNNGLDNWKGWSCEAGATRLFIDKDFNAYGGECKNDYLGSVLDDFNILDKTICTKDRCTGCTDDLIVAKKIT
jgi:hypothetical protein